MSSKVFVSFGFGAALLASQLVAQSDAPQTVQPAPAQAETMQPQGYLDPNFNAATDKPHAGTPAQPNATAAPAPAQTGNGDWYKSSPQSYDHAAKSPRHFHVPKSESHLKVYDDTRSQQQVAQTAEQPAQYAAQPPQYSAQPQYSQPAQQYRQVQPVPEYYGQQNQQAYAEPPQGSSDPGYAEDPGSGGDDQPIYGDDQSQQYAAQPTQQPLDAQQLEQLVAPIALYPDQLVAQILTASTYPAQVTAADQWLRQMNGTAPEQIAAAASAQTQWDPSIKALTAFPQVLQMLDSNLQWTSALGNAYYNQPQDVLNTIQVLRERAQQAGNLQTTSQTQVVDDPGYIQIEPAQPDYVYVPSYNPWYVYGEPIAPYPAFAFGDWGLYIGGGIRWGLGFAVQPFLGFGWGWGSWGFDWAGCGILYHDDYYWTHSREMRDWGFEHGGRRWHGGGRDWDDRGRNMARFGDYHHQAMNVHDRPLGRGFGGPRQQMGHEGLRGFGHVQGGGPMHRPENPRMQSFGNMPRAYGRPQQFQRGGQNFGNRGQAFGGPRAFAGGGRPLNVRPEPYRSLPQGRAFGGQPRMGYGQGSSSRPQPIQNFGGRPYSYAQPRGGPSRSFGESFNRPEPRMGGGFHSFGGGHSAPSYGGGRSFNQGFGSRGFAGGGGHSFGGGGHAFGGGGHSFGGGGHAFGGGGGHSFGGGGGHFGGGGHSFGGGGGHSGGGGHGGGGGRHR